MAWPENRPEINPDRVWNEETGTWIDNDARGSGRYKNQIIAIGIDTGGNGKVYFGEV